MTENAASSRLYSSNAFRILGLHVDASVREIGRHAERLAVQLKFGERESDRWHAFLGEVDPADLATAPELLADPERRLLEEAFWFWPIDGDGSTDVGLKALERGEISEALEIWGATQCEASAHNLAVYNHAVALSLVERSAGRSFSETEDLRRDLAWRSALAWWVEVLDGDVLEHRLSLRATQLDDPRATRSLAVRVARAVERIVVAAAVAPAVAAAGRRDASAVARHMEIVRASDLDQKLVSHEVRERTESTCSRIRTLCGVAGETDKETQGLEAAQRLLEEARPLLQEIDAFFDSSDLVRSAAHDEVANAARGCLIRYANATKDWAGTEVLFQTLPAIVAGKDARRELEESLAVLRENLAGAAAEEATTVARSTCWFCGGRLGLRGKALVVPLNRNVNTQLSGNIRRTTWDKAELAVPRCEECYGAHDLEDTYTNIGRFAGGVVGVVAAFCLFLPETWVWALIEILVFAYAGLAVGRFVARRDWPTGTRPKMHQLEFGPLAESLESGWSLGSEPGAVESVFSGKGPFVRLSAFPKPVAIGATVIAVLGLVPLLAMQGKMGRSGTSPAAPAGSPARSSPTTPAGVSTSPPPAASPRSSSPVESGEVTRLRTRIDAERSRLTKEGTELAALGADLSNLTSQISALKSTLQRYERERAAGVYVDGDAITSAQGQHNALVAKRKALLRKRDALQASNSQAIALFNIDVEEYNRLSKR